MAATAAAGEFMDIRCMCSESLPIQGVHSLADKQNVLFDEVKNRR